MDDAVGRELCNGSFDRTGIADIMPDIPTRELPVLAVSANDFGFGEPFRKRGDEVETDEAASAGHENPRMGASHRTVRFQIKMKRSSQDQRQPSRGSSPRG